MIFKHSLLGRVFPCFSSQPVNAQFPALDSRPIEGRLQQLETQLRFSKKENAILLQAMKSPTSAGLQSKPVVTALPPSLQAIACQTDTCTDASQYVNLETVVNDFLEKSGSTVFSVDRLETELMRTLHLFDESRQRTFTLEKTNQRLSETIAKSIAETDVFKLEIVGKTSEIERLNTCLHESRTRKDALQEQVIVLNKSAVNLNARIQELETFGSDLESSTSTENEAPIHISPVPQNISNDVQSRLVKQNALISTLKERLVDVEREQQQEYEQRQEALQSLQGVISNAMSMSWKHIPKIVLSLIEKKDSIDQELFKAHQIIDQQHETLLTRSSTRNHPLSPATTSSVSCQTDDALIFGILPRLFNATRRPQRLADREPADNLQAKCEELLASLESLRAQRDDLFKVNKDIKKLIVNSAVGSTFGKKSSLWGSDDGEEKNVLELYNDALVQLGLLRVKAEEMEYKIAVMQGVIEQLTFQVPDRQGVASPHVDS